MIWELLWGYEKGTSGPWLCRRDSWEKTHGDNRENHRPPSVMSWRNPWWNCGGALVPQFSLQVEWKKSDLFQLTSTWLPNNHPIRLQLFPVFSVDILRKCKLKSCRTLLWIGPIGNKFFNHQFWILVRCTVQNTCTLYTLNIPADNAHCLVRLNVNSLLFNL